MKTSWSSPSNIAIIKYWGKHGNQLPRNASISFTLSEAKTRTTLEAFKRSGPSEDLISAFYFEGAENPSFGQKSADFFSKIRDEFEILRDFTFVIRTENTFPHSSGIASSASGMSALALCLLEAEIRYTRGEFEDNAAFRNRASELARLGSGSACRSVFPYLASWGVHPLIPNSSDTSATPVQHMVHPVFLDYHDDILIVSKKEKAVSSTAGHGLMEGNVFASARYKQAAENMTKLLDYVRTGDVHGFGNTAEDEALTLHALMMCSRPSFMLLHANTVEMIDRIRKFRLETKLPVYFTLDAGPNIHLLYPHENFEAVDAFIASDLKPLCENGRMIRDRVGQGPQPANPL